MVTNMEFCNNWPILWLLKSVFGGKLFSCAIIKDQPRLAVHSCVKSAGFKIILKARNQIVPGRFSKNDTRFEILKTKLGSQAEPRLEFASEATIVER